MPVVEDLKSVENTAPAPVTPQTENQQPFYVSQRKLNFAEKNKTSLVVAGGVAVIAVVGGVMALSHKADAPARPSNSLVQQQAAAPPPPKPVAGVAMPGDQAAKTATATDSNELTASDLENTKTPDGAAAIHGGTSGTQKPLHFPDPTVAGSGPSGSRPLGSIQPFTPPQYQAGIPGQPPMNAAATNEASRAYEDEVTKPSLVFTAQAANGPEKAQGASAAQGGAEPITNFGLEPGFHVAAHLEASVSTLGGAPAVAVVEYDYSKEGHVLIPAGSRLIGKIGSASSTGLVSLAFSEIYLPNGTHTPINAVGLDSSLHLLKGKVTGKNTGKQFLLASITGLGSMGALFAGGNSGAALSQQDIMKEQLAGNVGQAGDQMIQNLQVTQHIVVTVAAGTQVYATFVASAKSLSATQGSDGTIPK